MLTDFSKEFNVIINKPTFIVKQTIFLSIIKRFETYLSNNGFTYYGIFHDRDVAENGELKTIHYHIVITSIKRMRLSTMLTRICTQLSGILHQLEIENEFPVFCISIDKVFDLPLSIQYLIHINDTDKYQYDKKDIDTNSTQTLREYLNTNHLDFDDIEVIVNLCKQYPFELDLIGAVGVKKYIYYKRVFDLVRQDLFKYTNYGQARIDSAIEVKRKVRKG